MVKPRVVYGLLLACVVSPASAADVKLSGLWTGTYEYPAGSPQLPVPFEMRFAHAGEKFVARTSEPNSFGEDKTDENLFADCQGTYDLQTRKLTWTKTYDGTSNATHSVEYAGTLSEDGATIEGTWDISGFSGKFALTRAKTGPKAGMLQALWTGTYEYLADADQGAVKFGMTFAKVGNKFVARTSESNTFGDDPATNPKLFADCKGAYDPDSGKVTWTKTYDGTANVSHAVEYAGTLSEDGTRIDGTWTIGEVSGKFTLKKARATDK